MALIPPDLLTKLAVQQQLDAGPILNRFSTLDDEMQKIISNTGLPADVKHAYFHQALRRYEGLKSGSNKPISIDLVKPPPSNAPKRELPEDQDSIIARVPKNRRMQGKLLLRYLQDNAIWDDKQQLIHEGQPVLGSNFYDLFNDLVRDYKTEKRHPVGFDQLSMVLRNANVPEQAIGHKRRWQQIMHRSPPPSPGGGFPMDRDDDDIPSTSQNTPGTIRQRQVPNKYTPYDTPRGRSARGRRTPGSQRGRQFVNSGRLRRGSGRINWAGLR